MSSEQRDHERDEAPMPPGLILAYDVITPQEEADLIAAIEAMGLPPFVHDPGNPRCTRTFGWDYGWPSEAIMPCEPLPMVFHGVRNIAARLAGTATEELIQGMVIRYEPGSTIQWHCDKRVWDHVVGLSLGDRVAMGFRKAVVDGHETVWAELPARSMYALTGEARHVYEHGLPVMQGTRWSITFRSFSAVGKSLRDEALSPSG